jgi:hypothetical protein
VAPEDPPEYSLGGETTIGYGVARAGQPSLG